jgi:arginine:pyruvate transaminase
MARAHPCAPDDGPGEPVILLTIGEPDQPTPDELIDATHRALQAGRTGYSSGRGESAVLQALAAKYSARSGRTVGSRPVHLGAGHAERAVPAADGAGGNGRRSAGGRPLLRHLPRPGAIATGAVTVPVALRESAASGSTPTTWRAP